MLFASACYCVCVLNGLVRPFKAGPGFNGIAVFAVRVVVHDPVGGLVGLFAAPLLRLTAAPLAHQPRVAFTIFTTLSITGTSISTPTTVASAAPEEKPNRLIAAATASSKKLLAPIRADGAATL